MLNQTEITQIKLCMLCMHLCMLAVLVCVLLCATVYVSGCECMCVRNSVIVKVYICLVNNCLHRRMSESM